MNISLEKTVRKSDPMYHVYDTEFTHIFLSFCSYVCIIKNKKMNLPNIFLWLLKEQQLRDLFKMLCDVETDYDVLKCFLEYDPSLHRSKYIRNYLASADTLKNK